MRTELYEYDWFDIPPTAGTNALPLAITTDALSRVWVNQEFHLDFRMLDPVTGVVTALPIPKPPGLGPFATMLFGDHRTQISGAGEDILVDPDGRVWLSEGGGMFYYGAFPNHSRVVRYDPDAQPGEERYRVYNVPGDYNEVWGLRFDPQRQRMWFTTNAHDGPPPVGHAAKLISFDPDKVRYDNRFDFSTPLEDLVCAQGAPDADCFHEYPLPNSNFAVGHMALDAAGQVWYTGFWGRTGRNVIGRLDPVSGSVEEFPLPAPIGRQPPVPFVGSGPWQILIAPNGDVLFNEHFDNTLCRFRIERLGDPACTQLDAAGRNPCIDELVVPDVDLAQQTLHSIALDARGNLWFTLGDPNNPDGTASLGYVAADWSQIVRLPPLAVFPGTIAFSGMGIAIDRTSGDIWFAEFWGRRIGRLRRLR